ncbi:MAG: iron-containing alcohol dehydrogenase [Spirochaetales bacterium]|uniref:Iron-containing alcohol dehydrogenase n=1 Tax=Candidatus Thalassospirochaeta sargassi TaxID=3119039 RepID=A0AAJ1IGC9_9SPIO|nr:iron-containing alcohol dehydrogenase [Spirochaetales bacterium]
MNNFEFRNPVQIVFGKKTEERAGELAAQYGAKKVLLHYGGGSIKKSGLYDRIVKSLESSGIVWAELPGVKPNPRLSLVREGVTLCREENIDLILAVGGGSVIDSAKAIGIGVKYDGDVWDFYTGKAEPQESLPTAVVLTIPAAGSESSQGSVITNEDGGLKRPVNAACMFPAFSICNPELAFTLPVHQIAAGTADIFAHMHERYFTNIKHVDLTDRLIEAGMRNIIHHAPRLLDASEDYDTWAEVMWTGTVAHNNILDTGRLGDWASHDIEHELSGMFDIAHGAGLAIIIPAWMKFVYKHDVERFAQFAERVFFVERDYADPEKTVLEGIYRLEQHFKRMGMAVRLSEVGITADSFEEMADRATSGDTATLGNFVKLDKESIIRILKLAE